jgi:hypothetical protein
MSKETQAFDAVIKNIKLSINTFAPARIVNYYPGVKAEADIEILFKYQVDSYGNTARYAMVNRVPVMNEVKTTLQPNDMVFVAFAQRALDNLQEVPFDPGFRSMFAIKDAVVIGSWG